jgi:antitoxin YefM
VVRLERDEIINAQLAGVARMSSVTASQTRANLHRLINQVAESHQPIVIAGKRNSAVLLSAVAWQAIQETLHLLSIPGMRKSIRHAMAEPLSKSATTFRGSRTSERCGGRGR